ncbi:Uncharacterized protein APZ42_011915 [Daphnia magna]|uniref:Uncharacterized protein n=1 Tax=Daphnia magna TaxID=35525 RepID=A0A162SDT8_9CRUS|nr:Uncharacterized protein APZ42_011915 [Daphnia magna]
MQKYERWNHRHHEIAAGTPDACFQFKFISPNSCIIFCSISFFVSVFSLSFDLVSFHRKPA